MRPQREVLIAVAILAVVFGAAAYLASRAPKTSARIGYATTFSAEPPGAQAIFNATQQLGIGARRFRKRPAALEAILDSTRRQLLAIIGPDELSPAELTILLKLSERTDMLLAGQNAELLFRCFGYDITGPRGDSTRVLGGRREFEDFLRRDSVQVAAPGAEVGPRSPWVSIVFAREFKKTIVDSSRRADASDFACTVPVLGRVDTLLITARKQLVALRIQRDSGGPVLTLVADHGLFRNSRVRRTDAGEFVLGLIAGRYDEVIFEEYHHGFGERGSLRGAVMGWSRSSPWGWGAWQLALVGLLALAFGAVRFGPILPGIARTRRSSLEHVTALATALAAARGHDEAIAAIVRGLRRRLAPGGRQRGEWREWLQHLGEHASGAREQQLIAELVQLTAAGQPARSVLRAANTVEELWQELRP